MAIGAIALVCVECVGVVSAFVVNRRHRCDSRVSVSLDSAWSLDLPAAESLLWTKLFTVVNTTN